QLDRLAHGLSATFFPGFFSEPPYYLPATQDAAGRGLAMLGQPGGDLVANAPRPTAPTGNVEAIPAELKDVPQWVCWRYLFRNGRWTKPPVDCRTGKLADVAKAGVGVSFNVALSYYQRTQADGIGLVFTPDGPYSGVDLDDCRDPGTGQFEPWADS